MSDLTVDYRTRTTVPIRDMGGSGRIVCLVDIYGWTKNDVATVPGGTDPVKKAIAKLGLDPDRYAPYIMDLGQYELGADYHD